MPKNIKVPFGMGQPSTCTSDLVYMCAGGAQGSQIFKQNSIISIHSCFIVFRLLQLQVADQVGRGI